MGGEAGQSFLANVEAALFLRAPGRALHIERERRVAQHFLVLFHGGGRMAGKKSLLIERWALPNATVLALEGLLVLNE